jgi:hypothetical protein
MRLAAANESAPGAGSSARLARGADGGPRGPPRPPTRATVDDADLPEHARLDDREGQLRAVRGPDHDLDPAGDDQDQGVARITCGKQHLTAAHGPEPGRPDPYLLWLENRSGRS